MKNNASFAYGFFLIIGDFFALLSAFVIAYIVRFKLDIRPVTSLVSSSHYLKAVLVVLPLWIIVNGLIGLYNPAVYEKRFTEIGRLFIGAVLGMLVLIGFDYFTDRTLFPARLVPIFGLLIGFGFLVLFRTIARFLKRQLYKYGIGISNVLVVGHTKSSDFIAEQVADTKHSGQHLLGVVGAEANGFQHYSAFEEAIQKIKKPIHLIIQTELYSDQAKNNAILRYAQSHHVAYRFVPGNNDMFVGNISVELYGSLPMVAIHQTALVGWGRILKRLFDLFVGVFSLLILSPFLLVIAILVKLFDPKGPVLFHQIRLTRFNHRFKVRKFRTIKQRYSGMSPEAAFESMGKPELAKEYRANGDYLQNDPRISFIGGFLRHTSLDELPQLFNVIKGDLSLVGPRALVPEELEVYKNRHAILSVKSGLTGLAQISGRRHISFEDRRKLDIFYVQNWSFWLDLIILVKTLKAVITGSGAK